MTTQYLTVWMDLFITFFVNLEAQTLNCWVLFDYLEIKTAIQFNLSS